MTEGADGTEETDGFVWGEIAAETAGVGTEEAAESSKFEWCQPASEPTDASVSVDDSPELDPTLVTERRVGGSDDEAVALLTALRRDPTYGRWRRVDRELDRK